MRPKVGLVGKTFSAFWAIEWFFTCMGSDVTLKMEKKFFKEINTQRYLIVNLSHTFLFTLANGKLSPKVSLA